MQSQGFSLGAATLASTVCLAVTLAGCSGDGDGDETPNPGSSSSPSASSPIPGSTSSTPSTTDDDPGSSAIVAAGRTAEREVEGSTLVSIETERDGTWEIDVIDADGTTFELIVSADGSSVVSGPREERDSAADKAAHLTEAKAAKIDFEAAASRLLEEFPGGQVSELDLDTERGRVVWEADVLDSSGNKHEVDLDAGSGEVIASEVDD